MMRAFGQSGRVAWAAALGLAACANAPDNGGLAGGTDGDATAAEAVGDSALQTAAATPETADTAPATDAATLETADASPSVDAATEVIDIAAACSPVDCKGPCNNYPVNCHRSFEK